LIQVDLWGSWQCKLRPNSQYCDTSTCRAADPNRNRWLYGNCNMVPVLSHCHIRRYMRCQNTAIYRIKAICMVHPKWLSGEPLFHPPLWSPLLWSPLWTPLWPLPQRPPLWSITLAHVMQPGLGPLLVPLGMCYWPVPTYLISFT
jgi:hypothetical protein